MATLTFDKEIILDKEATERMAEIAAKPAQPPPDLGKDFWVENEKKVNKFLYGPEIC